MAAAPRCRSVQPCSRERFPASGAERGGGPSRRRRRGAWCCGRLWCGRYHEPRPPFCAAGAAMDLDAARVDEQAVGGALAPRKRAEDVLPDSALGPANEAVVEGLLRPVDITRAVGPAPA